MSSITVIEHAHISKSPKIQGGEPVVKGTRFPVRSVVHYILYEGKTPEELRHLFPNLSLAAIYDALAYYYDHKKEINFYIKEQQEHVWKKKLST